VGPVTAKRPGVELVGSPYPPRKHAFLPHRHLYAGNLWSEELSRDLGRAPRFKNTRYADSEIQHTTSSKHTTNSFELVVYFKTRNSGFMCSPHKTCCCEAPISKI